MTRTTGVREAHRFDETRLAQWMSAHVPGFTGMLAVEQFTGGQSNPTCELRTPGKHYVLRRKPPGQLLKGAHAVDREAQVLQALAKAGYPVAHVHGLCMDDAVIGKSFYVMDYVEGRIFWDVSFLTLAAEERPSYFDAMNDALARLHCLDFSAIGLADFAYHLMMYRLPPRIVAGLVGSDLEGLNIPSEADYVAAYCRRTGRQDIPNLDFYIAFNMFRLAAIFHGIKGRLARGTAASAHAQEYAAGVRRNGGVGMGTSATSESDTVFQ